MAFNSIDLKVYKEAFIAKLRKWFLGKKDPYLPLPSKLYLSPSVGIISSYKKVERKLAFSHMKDDPVKWQTIARKKLIEISGYEDNRRFPKIVKMNTEENLGESIFKRSFYLRVREKTDVPFHLIFKKPIREPCPIFIFLTGSTSGVHVGWGSKVVPIDHQRVAIGADMGKQAAKKGYISVGIEQAGYGERGERKLWKRSTEKTIDASNHLLLLGKTLMGYGASDISSVIDWLLYQNNFFEVNKNRLYLFGHSSGGTLALYASALDIRIKGTLASGSVGNISETVGVRGAPSGDKIIPNFLNWFETPDLLALNAPRSFVGLSGDKDHIYPYSGTKKVINEAKYFYKWMGFKNKINAYKVFGKHQYHAHETWKAWEKWIDKNI